MTNLFLFCLLVSCIHVFFLKTIEDKKIFYPIRLWVQTYAPGWIPREILGDCALCTSFWIAVLQMILCVIAGKLDIIYALMSIFIIPVLTEIIYLQTKRY